MGLLVGDCFLLRDVRRSRLDKIFDRLVRDKFNYPSQKMMIRCLQQNSKLLNHQMLEILQIYRPQQHSYAWFQMFSHLQLFCHDNGIER